MANNGVKVTPVAGVWKTVSAGFELTTRYPWLLILPVLLDLFLWLGPRLSFGSLVQQLLAQLPLDAALMDPRPMMDVISTRTNMFTYLSVLMLGVPALMTGLTPEKTPTAPLLIDVNGWGAWFGLLIGLTLVGLLLAAIYTTLIAVALARSESDEAKQTAAGAGDILQCIGRTWLRFSALTGLFLAIVIFVFVPVSIAAGLVSLLSQLLATLVLLAAPVVLVWITIFLSFAPQGMVLNRKSFVPTLGESIRLFQENLSSALALLLVVIVTRQLLAWLLLSADDGSWLTLASILGHAFVSTALSAALLIFYRDRYRLMPGPAVASPEIEPVNL